MNKRFQSVDIFRGISVILFLFFNALGSLTVDSQIPFFLKHNQGNVLLFGDFIAGFFAFLIGVGLSISYSKVKENSFLPFLQKHGKRFLILLLIGLFLDGILPFKLEWGVLQSLAIAGTFALIVLPISNRIKYAIGIGSLTAYQFLLMTNQDFFNAVNTSIHGGLFGAISYGTISIFGTIAGAYLLERQSMKAKMIKLLLGGLLLLVCTIILVQFYSFNKLLVNAPYSLVVSSVSFVILAILYVILEERKVSNELISLFSRNSLSAWILQYPLLFWPLSLFFGYQNASFFEGFLLSTCFLSIVTLALLFFEKRNFKS